MSKCRCSIPSALVVNFSILHCKLSSFALWFSMQAGVAITAASKAVYVFLVVGADKINLKQIVKIKSKCRRLECAHIFSVLLKFKLFDLNWKNCE